jgi:hypothetical protein
MPAKNIWQFNTQFQTYKQLDSEEHWVVTLSALQDISDTHYVSQNKAVSLSLSNVIYIPTPLELFICVYLNIGFIFTTS